jgi:hypothetical protein
MCTGIGECSHSFRVAEPTKLLYIVISLLLLQSHDDDHHHVETNVLSIYVSDARVYVSIGSIYK